MEGHSSSENEYDSDRELQVAFKKGLIKGMVYETEEPVKKIYNEVGLRDALSRIQSQLLWIERMDVTVDPVPPPKVMLEQIGGNPDDLEAEEDLHNEFKRESKFYRLAQAAVKEGIAKLCALNIETKRPTDYFAEMAKSDDHMKKVRAKLQSLQVAKDRIDKVKKLRELKKFGKKVQHEVLLRKQKEKRETLDAVKKYRKGQSASLDFIEKDDKKNKPHVPNKKRELKNKKFGFGGQKKRSKYNTKDSTNDVTESFKRFNNRGKGNKANKGNKKGVKKRPGKQRRQNARSRN